MPSGSPSPYTFRLEVSAFIHAIDGILFSVCDTGFLTIRNATPTAGKGHHPMGDHPFKGTPLVRSILRLPFANSEAGYGARFQKVHRNINRDPFNGSSTVVGCSDSPGQSNRSKQKCGRHCMTRLDRSSGDCSHAAHVNRSSELARVHNLEGAGRRAGAGTLGLDVVNDILAVKDLHRRGTCALGGRHIGRTLRQC